MVLGTQCNNTSLWKTLISTRYTNVTTSTTPVKEIVTTLFNSHLYRKLGADQIWRPTLPEPPLAVHPLLIRTTLALRTQSTRVVEKLSFFPCCCDRRFVIYNIQCDLPLLLLIVVFYCQHNLTTLIVPSIQSNSCTWISSIYLPRHQGILYQIQMHVSTIAIR